MKILSISLLLLIAFSYSFNGQAQTGLQILTGENINSEGSQGYLKVGFNSAENIAFDGNEIEVKSGLSNPGLLQLNPTGTATVICNNEDNPNGKLGIGTNTPIAKLHVKEKNGQIGIEMSTANNGTDWGFRILNKDLQLIKDNILLGKFDDADGMYSTGSDKRLKKSIEPMQNGALTQLMNLQPTSYFFKDDPIKKQKSYGYIAQEVQKVFPEAIQSTKGNEAYLTINYDKIGVLAVKAIQELTKTIETKSDKIEQLESVLVDLETKWSKIETAIANKEGMNKQSLALKKHPLQKSNGAYLEQNYPNPFRQQTMISYFLPKDTKAAYLQITNNTGNLIKQIPLLQKGKRQMNLSLDQLANGLYHCSLIVDGQFINSRKMLLQTGK